MYFNLLVYFLLNNNGYYNKIKIKTLLALG